jgi:hypothetical protein
MMIARDLWYNLPKKLYRTENSVESFAYFNTLASQRDSKLNFNYRKNDIKTKTDNNIFSNRYTLIGYAGFIDLYRFIWKLENYAPLYVIEELEILPISDKMEKEKIGNNAVQFLMTVKSYSAEIDDEVLLRLVPDCERVPVKPGINPFAALIKKQLPPNKEELMVVDNVVLLGMSDIEAYIKDSSGKIWTLGKGDRVYLGELTTINPDAGKVEFTLNEGGFLRKVSLELSFKSNQQ